MHRRSALTVLMLTAFLCCSSAYAKKMNHTHLKMLNDRLVSLVEHIQILTQLNLYKRLIPELEQQGRWDIQTAVAFNQFYIDLAFDSRKSISRHDAEGLCHKSVSSFKRSYAQIFSHNVWSTYSNDTEHQIDELIKSLYESTRVKVAIPYKSNEVNGRLSCVSNIDETYVEVRDFKSLPRPVVIEHGEG